MTERVRAPVLALGLVVIGCASDDPPPAPVEGCGFGSVSVAVTTGLTEPVPAPDSACGAVVTEEEGSFPDHVAECSLLEHTTNPPSTGAHYPSWAAFRVYDTAVPRGYWVHSLEHGAVVLVYNCDDCADEVEAAAAMISELPEDPICARTGVARRVILTPDPALDVRWAAAAWRFTLRSDCFEPDVFRAFYLEHYAGGPENTCARGRDF